MSYRGVMATFPIGLQGLHGARNPSKLGPGHLVYTEGLDIDGGVLIKEGGANKLNASGVGGDITSGFSWSPTATAYHDIVFIDNGATGLVKRDAGLTTFPTTLVSGLTLPVRYAPHFCTGGGEAVAALRHLFMFSDTNQVQVLDEAAATMGAITTPAADWASSFPTFGVLHDNRLFAGGNASDQHRIYYSTLTNHEDFTGAGSGTISIFPGEGDELCGGYSFRGLLILFKRPRGIYVVDTRDATPANWKVQRLSTAVGLAGPHALVPKSNDILFLDPIGSFHLMSAVQDFGDIKASDIGLASDVYTFMRRNINIPGLSMAQGVWYPEQQKAYYMLPRTGSVSLDMRVIIDFSDPSFGVRYLTSRRDEASSIWMRRDALGIERPALGDADGFVWMIDQEDRDKDGASYLTEFETSDTDFSFLDSGFAGKTKNGQFLEIVGDLANQTTIEVIPVWDGRQESPIIFDLGFASAALDSFLLDFDSLSADGIVTQRRRLPGQGRRLKLIVRNNALADEIRISEVRVEFEVADERLKVAS